MIPASILRVSGGTTQLYLLVAVKPCIRRDGSESQYAVWRSHCRACGVEFTTTSPATLGGIAHGLAVHCPEHRQKAVGRKSARRAR